MDDMCDRCEKIDARLNSIATQLNSIQERILHKSEFSGWQDKLDALVAEIQDLAMIKRLSFENGRRLGELYDKARYLMAMAQDLALSQDILALQEQLKSIISGEAWDLYMAIEAVSNARLNCQAECWGAARHFPGQSSVPADRLYRNMEIDAVFSNGMETRGRKL
ncbi:MAG TPA: hypothetical protein GX506_08395 [Firmicutes bacterium]|nr:hypothetical protein [Bacillota bacterium]